MRNLALVLGLLGACIATKADAATQAPKADSLRVPLLQSQGRLESKRLDDTRLLSKQERVRATATFFSQPDLIFSDSFARNRQFLPGTLPRLEIFLDSPTLLERGRYNLTSSISTGLAVWRADVQDSQRVYEVPVQAGLTMRRTLTKTWSAVASLDLAAALYWSDHSYLFSDFSGWGWSSRAGLGAEYKFQSSAIQALLVASREKKEKNLSTKLGLSLGWGIYL